LTSRADRQQGCGAAQDEHQHGRGVVVEVNRERHHDQG
jgi:hypothetical protein